MPTGGRPSGGLEARRRHEYMEWQAQQSRFEELDTEDEAYAAQAYGGRAGRFPSDKLHFTGYDVGSGQQEPYDDLAYGDGHGMGVEDEEMDEGVMWQHQMRQQEEETAHRAMRRMHRARLRGDPECPLSREEIDALERRQLIPRQSDREAQASTAPTKAAAPKAKGKAVQAASSRAPLAKTKGTKSAARTSPVSASPSRRTSETALATIGSPSKRAPPRSSSGPVVRQQPGMSDPRDYRPSSSSSRASPTPQEHDTRARSSSAAQFYGNPYGQYGYGYPPMPMQGVPQYTQHPGRRNISGPAAYPGPGARAATRAVRREREIIVISDDEEQEEASDDESDEGVALESPQLAIAASGYSTASVRAPAPRARRGGR